MKLELAAIGYAIVAPAMISAMAADQHRLTLLDTLTEAHLSLLPLLAEGMTDERTRQVPWRYPADHQTPGPPTAGTAQVPQPDRSRNLRLASRGHSRSAPLLS